MVSTTAMANVGPGVDRDLLLMGRTTLFPEWTIDSRRDPEKRAALLERVSRSLAFDLGTDRSFMAFVDDVQYEEHVLRTPGDDASQRVVASLLMQWESIGYAGDDIFELAFQDAASVAFGSEGVARSDYRHHANWSALQHIYAESPHHRDAVMAFLRAIYAETQRDFARRGLRRLLLWRGEELDIQAVGLSVETFYPRPLSSWTAAYPVAVMFAGLQGRVGHDHDPYALGRPRRIRGRILLAEIPVERVFSTGWTGVGGVTTTCEVVILSSETIAWALTRRQNGQPVESEAEYLALVEAIS